MNVINANWETDEKGAFTNSCSKIMKLYPVKKSKATHVRVITEFLSYDNIQLASGIHCHDMWAQ